ncbi:hypothetical protein DAMA08_028670 [Martiniozyma asiatica (nom. inval.)]|nr:hypothetical protein DAMA08_028670 [Martiniozyma asiatica]
MMRQIRHITILTPNGSSSPIKAVASDLSAFNDSHSTQTTSSPLKSVASTTGTPHLQPLSSSLLATLPASISLASKHPVILSTTPLITRRNLLHSTFVATEPTRILISPFKTTVLETIGLGWLKRRFSKHNDPRFVVVSLDGTVDWYVPHGVGCSVGCEFKGKVVTGRGQIGIVGNGGVYRVDIDDEFWVRKSSLVGMSLIEGEAVKGKVTLESKRWDGGKDKDGQIKQLEKNLQDDSLLGKIKSFISVATKWSKKIGNFAIGGGDYYVLKGPRTVLVETGTGMDIYKPNLPFEFPSFKDPSTMISSKPLEKESTIADNLGVVRIEGGKVTQFQNVTNFDKEAARISLLKKH